MFRTRALHVFFGSEASDRIAEALKLLGTGRGFLVTTPGQAKRLEGLIRTLEPLLVGVFDRARVHVPVHIAASAADAAQATGADVLIAVGGGSAIGVAKAAALRTDLPIVAVPTTYSGSEMTNVWGVREKSGKHTGRDERVAPRVVVYDPELTVGLPPETSAASGMNAVAHCVEAAYAMDGSPVASLFAVEGARALARALPMIVQHPEDPEARASALYGAYLAGSALDVTSMGLHHKLCHVLGGMYDLPHALTHAILLPHVAAYNAPFAPEAMEQLGGALGTNPSLGLLELNRTLGITRTLHDLGLRPHELDAAAEAATMNPYPNPAPVTKSAIRRVLEAAWRGEPGTDR